MNLTEAGALAAIIGAVDRGAVVADAIPNHPVTLTWGRASYIGARDRQAALADADVLDLFLFVKVDGLATAVGWAIRDLIPRYISGWFIVDFDVESYGQAITHAPEHQGQGWPDEVARLATEPLQVQDVVLARRPGLRTAPRTESRPPVRVRPEDLLAVPGEDGEDPPEGSDAEYDTGAASLLPTGELMNPAHPEHDPFYEQDQVAYVVRETSEEGPGTRLRVLTSFSALSGWGVGTEHDIRHDQTWHPLGRWAVTGIRNYRSGAELGEIPDRPLRHWVFK